MSANLTFAEAKDYLDEQPLPFALWWFVENVNEDNPDRSELFFYLRERERDAALTTYTAFCQQASGGGTIWIEQVEATNLEEATATAKQACADAWEYDPEDVHVLGIAEGNVNVLLWDDLGD